jgi:hypothetical protein
MSPLFITLKKYLRVIFVQVVVFFLDIYICKHLTKFLTLQDRKLFLNS